MLKQTGNHLTLSKTKKRSDLIAALVEMYRIAVTQMPADVIKGLEQGLKRETQPRAKHVLKTMLKNIDMACDETRPLCQDTGIPLVYVQYNRKQFSQAELKKILIEATHKATKEVPLRPNALDVLTGKVHGNHPVIHFREVEGNTKFQLLLKGGGSENVSRVYQLPERTIGAERDLDGIEKVIVDAVVKAQGRGCPPYIIGAAVCGNMEEASYRAKNSHLKGITEHNRNPKIAAMEKRLLKKINALDIGPMGVGGKTTALAVKANLKYVHPASWFVGISIGCWSMRRATLEVRGTN